MHAHTCLGVLVLSALGLLGAGPARAHDTWLLPRKMAVEPGTAVVLELTSGMTFTHSETAIKPERIVRAAVRLAGATADLGARRPADHALEVTADLPRPGVATLWIELGPRPLELKPPKVEEYLNEIGASSAIRQAWKTAKPRRWREVYVKHAKTFVRVGQRADDRSWAEPVGLRLEIVPEVDPTALAPGAELPVRVLRDGKPFAGFPLGLVREGEHQGTLQTTDADGRVVFRVARAGRWLLRGTDLRRSTQPETDWESDFTTLTLEVR